MVAVRFRSLPGNLRPGCALDKSFVQAGVIGKPDGDEPGCAVLESSVFPADFIRRRELFDWTGVGTVWRRGQSFVEQGARETAAGDGLACRGCVGRMSHIAVRLLLSLIFTALGIAGAILPVLPGWIFFALVVFLLFPEAQFTRRSVARLERHFPRLRRVLRFFLPSRAQP